MNDQDKRIGEKTPLTQKDAPRECCDCSLDPILTTKFRVTLIVSLWGFLTCMERAIILPTLWLYLKTFWSLEAARNFYAATMSSFSLAVLLTTPICGYLADKGYRSKMILLVCNQFGLIGNIVYLFAPHPAVVLVGRLLAGLGAGCEPPIFADITRVTTKQERTKFIIITLLSRQFGLIFGPVFTLILEKAEFSNGGVVVNVYNAPGLILGICWILHTLLTLFAYPSIDYQGREVEIPYQVSMNKKVSKKRRTFKQYLSTVFTNEHKPEEIKETRSLWESLAIYRSYPIATLLILGFNCYFCLMSLETVLTPLADDLLKWNEVQVSYVYLACSLMILIVFVLLHIATNYCSDWALALVGSASLMLTYIWITINLAVTPKPAHIYNAALIIFGIMIHVFGLPFALACGESLYTKHIPVLEMDRAQSILRLVMNSAYLTGPLIGGGLWFVGSVVFSIMAAQMIISTILLCNKSAFDVPEELADEATTPTSSAVSEASELDKDSE
ncbi:hypothetical protein Ciccas_001035 [Cichlidogyrus casuarinus]|uniref:Major facilitator superfamily (MFS) profile domain-containing protein n=1 Tax=Cichlidogyrus casuarinus TaxID=1844966 RepID=A0ABD2QLE4_9PLAT